MAAKGGKQWWDPYKTSHQKQFVCHPNAASEVLLRPPSTLHKNSFSKSGPIGSSVYDEEFCWKPASKPECIRTGTASGQRRNNPHPSQGFMVWRLPRDAPPSYECLRLPCKCFPSKEEIHKAIQAQYCSTYKSDFMGVAGGNQGFRRTNGLLAHLHAEHQHIPHRAETEIRANYCQASQTPELIPDVSINSGKTQHVTSCGIVPTVTQRHMQTLQEAPNLTTYHWFYGKRPSYLPSLMRTLLPQELQQLNRIMTDIDKKTINQTLRKNCCISPEKKETKLPVVGKKACSSEWISSWPGPT